MSLPPPSGLSSALRRLAAAGLLVTVLGGCKAESARTYPLKGQILAIAGPTRPDGRREITVKHEDIPNFMPAMTMPYIVRPPAALDGLAPGDLFTATLVNENAELYLTDLKKTGHADLPADARAVKILDVMQPGDEVPDDLLQDQTGATRKLSDWRGRALAVTFVYTRCPLPDFCPLMDRQFAAAQRDAAADPQLRDRLHLLSITLDPSFDTPPILLAHARRAGADPTVWTFATGTPEDLDRFGSRFGVSVMRNGPSGSEVVHNLRTAILDPDGRLTTIFGGNDWSAADLLKELRRAAGNN